MRWREEVVDGRGAPHFLVEGKAIEDVLLRVECGEHLRFKLLLFGGERFRMVGFVRDEPGGDEMAGSGVIEGGFFPTLTYRHLASQGASVVIGMASFVGVGEDGVDAIQATGDLLGNEGKVSGGFLIRDRQELALRFADAGQRDGLQHLLAAVRGILLARRETGAGEVLGIAGARVRDVQDAAAGPKPGAGGDHLVVIMSYYN